MSCVFENNQVDFGCLREIISRVYKKELDVTTARMVLKQLDGGLSLVGLPDDVSVQSYDSAEAVAEQLEEYVPDDDVTVASPNYMQIVLLLLELLKLIRKG